MNVKVQKSLCAQVVRLFLVALPSVISLPMQAQHHEAPVATNNGPEIAPSYAWKMISPLGLREAASIDTSMINYATEFVPSAVSPAWVTTGNYGAEGMNMIFSQRNSTGAFFFEDALEHWMPLERY